MLLVIGRALVVADDGGLVPLAGPHRLVHFLLRLFRGFFGLLVLVAVVLILALFGVLGLVVLADVDERLIGLLVSLLERVHVLDGCEDVEQFLVAAGDADELVLHGLDGLDDLLALEGVGEVGDCEQEMLLLEVGVDLGVRLLLVLVLLQQLGLQVLQQLIDLNHRVFTLLVFSTNLVL